MLELVGLSGDDLLDDRQTFGRTEAEVSIARALIMNPELLVCD